MVTEMVYPDGSVHRYEYDGALGRLKQIKAVTDTEKWLGEGGFPTGITPFVTSLQYTPSGVVTCMEYANQTTQTWEFDNRKRISRIMINNSHETLEDLNYQLDGMGNILAINENEYAYDGFDRIIKTNTLLPVNIDQKKLVADHFGTYEGGAPVNGVEYNFQADLNEDGRINGMDHLLASLLSDDITYDRESFEYDQNGNRVKLVQNGDIYTYEYGERNRLAAVYRQEEGSFSPRLYLEFEYDANGNTVARTVYSEEGEVRTQTTFTYDTLDRVTRSVEGDKVTEYLYDNAGNRFIKKGPEGTTLYLRHGQISVAMDIEIPADTTDYDGKINRYVMSGDLLAGRITTTVKGEGTREVSLYYYHLDHLNSTKIVSDEHGGVDVRYVYRAFGEQLAKIGEGDARYTYGGKELDDETNLYYFNARYYDAVIGRFISEDPARDGTNWYVYVDNNPLRLVDPTGLRIEELDSVIDTVEGGTIETRKTVEHHTLLWFRWTTDVETRKTYRDNEQNIFKEVHFDHKNQTIRQTEYVVVNKDNLKDVRQRVNMAGLESDVTRIAGCAYVTWKYPVTWPVAAFDIGNTVYKRMTDEHPGVRVGDAVVFEEFSIIRVGSTRKYSIYDIDGNVYQKKLLISLM